MLKFVNGKDKRESHAAFKQYLLWLIQQSPNIGSYLLINRKNTTNQKRKTRAEANPTRKPRT